MVEGRRAAGGKASSDGRTGHRAGSRVNPKLRAYGSKHAWAAQAPTFDRARPPAGAQCGKAARWDLSGGTGATRPPTATLKDAWQQSRQALMRWVTVLAVGYAIPQMLAFTDPAHLAGLAEPAPLRAPGTRTAGLIQAGIARILREVGLPTFIAAIWGKIGATASGTSGSSAPSAAKAA